MEGVSGRKGGTPSLPSRRSTEGAATGQRAGGVGWGGVRAFDIHAPTL